MTEKINQKVLDNFGLKGRPVPLAGVPGLEETAFLVDNVVLKHIKNDSVDRMNWIARISDNITEDGFRIAKPLKTKTGGYVDENGWMAWTFLVGAHDLHGHITESMAAIIAFHAAIKDIARPSFFDKENSPFSRADAYAWGDSPKIILPEYKESIELLYSLRKPLPELREQVIHGDLNPYNILVSSDHPPAILDISPAWRPVEFALAVYAYWIGPWENRPEVLQKFSHVKEFKQLLVRAGIRMLVTMSEFNLSGEVERYQRATRIVAEFVEE